jgi:hypothetical protein
MVSKEVSRAMFAALSEEDSALSFINRTIERSCSDDPEDKHPELPYRRFVGLIAESNTKNIFKYCESPIERSFFVALQSAFIMTHEGTIFFESAPDEDIRQAQYERRLRTEKYMQPYIYYLNLPDDARPKTFKGFLQHCPGDLDEKAIQILHDESLFSYDFNHHNAIWITLQPKFIDFYCPGHSIRVDAIVWVPGNPSVKLVIECDGFDYHKDRKSFTGDRRRDRKLASLGYSVRRYSGSEIVTDLYGAVRDLHDHLNTYEFGWAYAEKWRAEYRTKHHEHITPSVEVTESWRELLRGDVT